MVRVGIAGIGFMGVTHYKALQQIEGAKVSAIFTRNPQKLAGDWRGIQGNFGPPGEVIDMRAIHGYEQFEALLADKSIDVVDLCLGGRKAGSRGGFACSAH